MNVIIALENQIGWLTAWRIGRYAQDTYQTQNFYLDAAANGMDDHRDGEKRKKAEEDRNKKQRAIEKAREDLRRATKKNIYVPYDPGEKDFDPALAQTQLKQAADEFREDYFRLKRTSTGNWTFKLAERTSELVYVFSDDFAVQEYARIKMKGNHCLNVMFPSRGESSNTQQSGGLLRALFDDQVHDSRAWFLHGATGAREPYGSYFLYRMIYFGERMSKDVMILNKLGRFHLYSLQIVFPTSTLLIDNAGKILDDKTEKKEQQIFELGDDDPTLPPLTLDDFIRQPALTLAGLSAEEAALQQEIAAAEILQKKKALILAYRP